MRKKPAGFNSKFKALRRSHTPPSERFDLGQHIEAVVDLDGVEMLVVVGQHLRRWKLRGIEFSYPVLVMPSGGPNADVGHIL